MNLGRTGRRVIKVNGKDISMGKNVVSGSVAELLSELEYVISIIYARGILEEGFEEETICSVIKLCHIRGKVKATEAIEKFK